MPGMLFLGVRKFGWFIFLLILTLTYNSVALAQEPPGPPRPTRTGSLVAPEREPVVLSTQSSSRVGVQTVIEFAPVADTYIASNLPNQNFGGADGLFLGYNRSELNYGAERVLLRFDLDGLPGDADIHSARLRLYLSFSDPAYDTPMGTVLRRIAAPWGEHSLTWNTEPTWGGIRASPSVGSSVGWYEWDITSLVADWVRGTQPNYGLEIIGDEHVQQRERAFFARETTTSFYPRLVIDYRLPPSDTNPPDVSVDPLPPYSTRSFTVSWSGTDEGEAGIAYYDVQYRVDDGDWLTWLEEVTFTAHEFSGAEDGRLYEFRARGVDNAGNAEPFGDAQAQTRVDTAPPISQIDPLPGIIRNGGLPVEFSVSWSGTDGNGSGIQCYDVQYQVDAGPWFLWQDCVAVSVTSATFTADRDGLYQFEVRALDNLGFLEAFANQGEAATVVDLEAPFLQPRAWMPIIFKN